jgi:hypothetical protein
MRYCTTHQAAHLVRGIIGSRDDRARAAHRVAGDTDRQLLPEPVAEHLDRRARAVQGRRDTLRHHRDALVDQAAERHRQAERNLSLGRDQSRDYGPRV